jgi:two-component system, NtrC family, response regulator GlrR
MNGVARIGMMPEAPRTPSAQRRRMAQKDDETREAAPGRTVAPLFVDVNTPSVVLDVLDGPERGRSVHVAGPKIRVGTNETNELALADPTVSRFHCEILVDDRGLRVRDLQSTNGTWVDGVAVVEAWLRAESSIRLGDTLFRVRTSGENGAIRISARAKFGGLVGRSFAMRALFAAMERAARTDSTCLITGETGTGKEEAALALHEASDRAEGPFVVVDCGALSPTLIESELFGHERGAYTDAHQTRVGAFEAAHGGTVFLDEVGELPLEVQPRLLRVLEARSVRRVGSHVEKAVDVRIVAATHRDLRARVNKGEFREDLLYRLAVIELDIPPLRERLEDMPLIAEALIKKIDPTFEPPVDPQLIAHLHRSSWPGNVRQLRNYLERAIHLDDRTSPPGSGDTPASPVDPRIPYEEARRRALDDFERRYLSLLLAENNDSVSEAARTAGVNRTYLHRLLRKHGLRG